MHKIVGEGTKKQIRKQIRAGAAGKDVDEIYQADQEAEDYNALSTEDDSDAEKSDTGADKANKVVPNGEAAIAAEEVQQQPRNRKERGAGASTSSTRGGKRAASQTAADNKIKKQFYEYPACYSVLITCLISYALIYFETSAGAKISSLSRTQTVLVLLAICIVSKNVFIQSRANRFIESASKT